MLALLMVQVRKRVHTGGGRSVADRRALSWQVSRLVHICGGITDSSLTCDEPDDVKMARNHMDETLQYLWC